MVWSPCCFSAALPLTRVLSSAVFLFPSAPGVTPMTPTPSTTAVPPSSTGREDQGAGLPGHQARHWRKHGGGAPSSERSFQQKNSFISQTVKLPGQILLQGDSMDGLCIIHPSCSKTLPWTLNSPAALLLYVSWSTLTSFYMLFV